MFCSFSGCTKVVNDNNDLPESSQLDSSSSGEKEESDTDVPDSKTTSAESGLSISNPNPRLSELLKKADEGGLLIGVNGNKSELDDIYGQKLYNSLDGFTETKEGHLYDGMIQAYVIYPDGTILGFYSSPMENVPEKYASCKGRMYGAIYKMNTDTSVASTVYGFSPAEASELPLDKIGVSIGKP